MTLREAGEHEQLNTKQMVEHKDALTMVKGKDNMGLLKKKTHIVSLPDQLGNEHDEMMDRLLKEYLVDLNIVAAARRAGMAYGEALLYYRHREFETRINRIIREGDPKNLFPANSLYFIIFREACNQIDGTPASRTAAAKMLMDKLGYGVSDNAVQDLAAVIKLSIGGPPVVDGDAIDVGGADE